jgi:SHS2 domain-containing protein
MSRGFIELDNITADIGIQAWGADLEEAFISAALGLASLLTDLPRGEGTLSREIRIETESLQSLLVQFLNEIIFLEEAEGFITCGVNNLKIKDNTLQTTLSGVLFDPALHTVNTHIKAATYHGLTIDETGEDTKISVIFDV